MLTTDGEGEKLQKVTLKEVNAPVILGQKPRITLFYTCQAVRLCESWHDAFACKRASTKLIMPFLSALCASTYKKEKPCPLGRKTRTRVRVH